MLIHITNQFRLRNFCRGVYLIIYLYPYNRCNWSVTAITQHTQAIPNTIEKNQWKIPKWIETPTYVHKANWPEIHLGHSNKFWMYGLLIFSILGGRKSKMFPSWRRIPDHVIPMWEINKVARKNIRMISRIFKWPINSCIWLKHQEGFVVSYYSGANFTNNLMIHGIGLKFDSIHVMAQISFWDNPKDTLRPRRIWMKLGSQVEIDYFCRPLEGGFRIKD